MRGVAKEGGDEHGKDEKVQPKASSEGNVGCRSAGANGNPVHFERFFSGARRLKSVLPIHSRVPSQVMGDIAIWGLQVAVNRINKEGGIAGRKVELLVEDDAGKPADAVRIMKKHVLQDNADFIIGGCSSAEAIPMVPVAEELETLFMVTVAEAPEMTAELCNKYTFRLTPDRRQKAKAMAPYMVKELGVKTWQMLYWDMAWGEGLRDEFRRELESLGGSLPVAIPIPPGTTDFAQYLTKLKPPQEVPGVFHGVASTDAIRMGKAIGEFGLQKKYTWAGTCCAMFSEVFQELNPSVDGIYVVDQYPDLPIPPLDSEWDMKFRAEFLEVSKGIPAESHSWSSMESLFVLKKAIEQAGGYKDKKKDTLKVIKAIEGQKGEKGPNFPQGPYYIRPEDHSGFLNLYIFQIKDGKEIMKKVIPYQETIFPTFGEMQDVSMTAGQGPRDWRSKGALTK